MSFNSLVIKFIFRHAAVLTHVELPNPWYLELHDPPPGIAGGGHVSSVAATFEGDTVYFPC